MTQNGQNMETPSNVQYSFVHRVAGATSDREASTDLYSIGFWSTFTMAKER